MFIFLSNSVMKEGEKEDKEDKAGKAGNVSEILI